MNLFLFFIFFNVSGDSEAERLQLKLPERTYSLWSHVNQPEILENLLNPLYEPNAGVIWPSVAPVSIQLWKELYFANTSAAPWNGLLGCAKHVKQNDVAVRKAAGQLRGQIRRALEDLVSNPESSCGSENEEGEEEEGKSRLAQLSLESQSTWYAVTLFIEIYENRLRLIYKYFIPNPRILLVEEHVASLKIL